MIDLGRLSSSPVAGRLARVGAGAALVVALFFGLGSSHATASAAACDSEGELTRIWRFADGRVDVNRYPEVEASLHSSVGFPVRHVLLRHAGEGANDPAWKGLVVLGSDGVPVLERRFTEPGRVFASDELEMFFWLPTPQVEYGGFDVDLECYSYDGQFLWTQPVRPGLVQVFSDSLIVAVDQKSFTVRQHDARTVALDRHGEIAWEIQQDFLGSLASYDPGYLCGLSAFGRVSAFGTDGTSLWEHLLEGWGVFSASVEPYVHAGSATVAALRLSLDERPDISPADLVVWNRDGEVIWTVSYDGHEYPQFCSVSADGEHLVVGVTVRDEKSKAWVIDMYDLRALKFQGRIEVSTQTPVVFAAPSPRGDLIAVCTADGDAGHGLSVYGGGSSIVSEIRGLLGRNLSWVSEQLLWVSGDEGAELLLLNTR